MATWILQTNVSIGKANHILRWCYRTLHTFTFYASWQITHINASSRNTITHPDTPCWSRLDKLLGTLATYDPPPQRRPKGNPSVLNNKSINRNDVTIAGWQVSQKCFNIKRSGRSPGTVESPSRLSYCGFWGIARRGRSCSAKCKWSGAGDHGEWTYDDICRNYIGLWWPVGMFPSVFFLQMDPWFALKAMGP